MTRFPEIRVNLRTANPFVLVAAVRQELRRAGIDRSEIEAFSRQALGAADPKGMRRVCHEWVDTTPRH